MKPSFNKFYFFLLLCAFLLNICESHRIFLQKEINTNEKKNDQIPETFFKISLKKVETSEANKKKFYDFISESQSELYTNFLIKSQKTENSSTMKKISLLNFQNIQVEIYFL